MELKELNEILKSLDVQNVTMSDGTYHRNPIWRDWENKTRKGISGGSIGPMTSTDAYKTHNRNVEERVKNTLFRIATSADPNNGEYKFDLGNKVRTLKFSWDQYPTYTRSADLDPSYQSFWYTLTVSDERKPKPSKNERYPNGYKPKIDYWNIQLDKALSNCNSDDAKRAVDKIVYFTEKENNSK